MHHADMAPFITSALELPPIHFPIEKYAVDQITRASSYTVGPMDDFDVITTTASGPDGEEYSLLVPRYLPIWILTHPKFRDGFERNYLTEEGEDDRQWKQGIPHTLNLIYSKLCGEGFEELDTRKPAPDFGAWEIGYLLRDFTRLARMIRPSLSPQWRISASCFRFCRLSILDIGRQWS